MLFQALGELNSALLDKMAGVQVLVT